MWGTAWALVLLATPLAPVAAGEGSTDAIERSSTASPGDERERCHRIVTYNAGYFLTEEVDDYPFFMGFVDVTAPASGFTPHEGSAFGGLVEWAFANNETLVSVTPESLTTIVSSGEALPSASSSAGEGAAAPNASAMVQVISEVDHFKFIAHRNDDGSGLMAPERIVLNNQICEEIRYASEDHVVDDPDSTVRASAQSRELAEGAFRDQQPAVLFYYMPDKRVLTSTIPKWYTKFNASIVNIGSKPLDVSTLSIKYYFKNPTGFGFLDPESFKVTFSDCMEVFGSFENLSRVDCDSDLGLSGRVRPLLGEPVDGADYVMDITFDKEGTWLSPIEALGDPSNQQIKENGEVEFSLSTPTGILIEPKLQVDRFDYGFFFPMNETSDYSFRPPADSSGSMKWITNPNITVEVSNRTVWGTDLEHIAETSRFNVIGTLGSLGMPGGSCNNHNGVDGPDAIVGYPGCMVIRRYCCSGPGGDLPAHLDGLMPAPRPAPRHGDGTTSKTWVYVLIGLAGLLLVFILLLGWFLYRRKKRGAADGAQGGEKREGERGSYLMSFLNPMHARRSSMESQASDMSLARCSSLRDIGNGTLPEQKLNGRLSLRDLNTPQPLSVSTASPEHSPTSALGISLFKNPFAILPRSPKLELPNVFSDSVRSGQDLFRVISPNDVKPLRFIGSGAFGSVYEAVLDKERGRVAVKLVNIRETSSRTLLESFEREVDVLSRVKHQNVVKLHGACMCPPNVFIVMELLTGSLRQKLDEVGRLKYREILVLANEISSALAYLHPTIVHRDLKPQNILIDGSGAAKVADFGIAKFKQSTYLQTTKGNGTPSYMAPESFGSERISEKADVFSLGMILWECYTGEAPWKEVEIPFQVVMLVGVEKKRPTIPEDCPRQLSSLIQRCWDDDPHRRPSCAEVERRTRLLLHELEIEEAAKTVAAEGEGGEV